MATAQVKQFEEKLQSKLPDGTTPDLPGWKVESRSGKTIYVSPDGQDYDSVAFIEEARRLQATHGRTANRSALAALNQLRCELHEGGQEDDSERGSADTHEGPPHAHAAKAKYAVYSQLQDWLCRGTHPLLRHMSLYVYSMWVYRVERNRFRKDEIQPSSQRADTYVGSPHNGVTGNKPPGPPCHRVRYA